ncbi:RagB/SusD family nutrient uptake outer membrane protein [Flexithrix dorotheae]|uniref:RagB/SusD family nutrient uptake outer membrane protein n=1 Tax=Flexithrix dorotheae TaxID=70993 RepID=UPI00036027D0|nr:RagB/SusD family nutrient uptake outer membrane protein [Flexithrix dorotheae]
MKRYSLYIKTGLVTLVLLTSVIISCNDEKLLDIDNPNAVTVNTFYQTEQDALLGLTSVYASWQARGLCNRMYFFGNDMPTDESLGTNNLQAVLRQMLDYSWESDNTVIFEMWRDYYQGVSRANRFLAGVADIEMDETLKNRLIAEARFLRATFYFDLTNKWGGVPLITIPPDDAINQPRASQTEVYNLIQEDLTFAKNNLPTRSEYDGSDAGRATSGAAAGYLGKVYLYQEKWAEAEAEFDAIINGNYGLYGLVPNFRWNGIGEEQEPLAENSVESLFEVQFQDALGSVWGIDNNGGGENTFRGVEYAFASFNNVRPRQDFADRFELGDPRYEQTFYDDSVAWFQGTFTKEEFGGLIAWRKYHNYDIRDDRNQSSGINFRLMRFADVLLMAAEAKLNNGKPISEVLELVNRVRKRALDQKTNPNIQLYMDRTLDHDLTLYPTADYPANTTEDVMKIIMHEREVELAGEQHRYNDLRRWGLDDDMALADGKPYVVGKHELWPIPLREIDTNSEISQADQNPNY